ncbi:MAG: polyprenyl synthetase family protein [Chloroflexi bacterium]|nr:polyprenyl synthetase family protein [Chloroflexota bacterium]
MLGTDAKERIYAPVADDLEMVIAHIAGVAESNSSGPPPEIESRLAQVLATPGKRIRPAITLLVSKLWGRVPDDRTIKMATAVELLHIASLIHDDTVDSADTRRGHATASNLWGGNIAVLLGDFVFATSATFVCDTNSVRLIRRFAQTIAELSRGELNEILDSWTVNTDQPKYLQRIYDKTASLFSTSAESGAVLGEADEEAIANLREYGYNLGMAYQVLDDLLDYESTTEQLGKPTANDLSNGVLTLPAILAMEDPGIRGKISKYLTTPVGARDEFLAPAYDAICQSDALERSRQAVNEYVATAMSKLEALPSSDSRDALFHLTDFIRDRKF